MGNYVFNIAKGRVVAYCNNVDTGSPADSRLVAVPVSNSGTADTTLKDYDTLALFLGDSGITERTTGGWSRQYIDNTGVTITVDDTNDRVDVDISDITWTSVTTGAVTDLLICYIPDGNATGGVSADSAVVPLTNHTFAVTPDGSDVTAVINSAGFFRAS